ncbi:MAG: hypothetical protein QCI00_03800, partial [Candidatus Thermoplasmatota archaeon]|nr:hypothetical protein [Candidatus Thermoplasmatota archaeon]
MAKTDDKLIGFSQRINDPAFKQYQKNRALWTIYFALGISVIAVIGFYLYGVYSSEMYNPEAIYVG